MSFEKEYERIASMLRIKFSRELTQKDPAAIEVVVILVLSLLMGWDTPSKVAEHLGLPKHEVYGALKKLTLHDWQRLFACAFENLAIQALLEAQSHSDATWSRLQVVVAIDDSVIRRWGQLLSYLGNWWSGQFHRVLPGQDIVMAVLRIGNQVIPLHFRIMSCLAQKGRHDKVVGILKDLAAKWKEAGIGIWRIPVSMDAGYADSGMIETIRELGFRKVLTGAKSSFILRPGRSKKVEAPLKELLGRGRLNREPGWSCKERVGFLKGASPKFGRVKVCARIMLGKVRWVFAFGIDRACEIVRVWQSHHWVEEFFKRMKHLLSWGSYRLKGTSGAHASIVVPFLAYFVLLELQQLTGGTFERLLWAIDQLSRIDMNDMLKLWDIKRFELTLVEPDVLLH